MKLINKKGILFCLKLFMVTLTFSCQCIKYKKDIVEHKAKYQLVFEKIGKEGELFTREEKNGYFTFRLSNNGVLYDSIKINFSKDTKSSSLKMKAGSENCILADNFGSYTLHIAKEKIAIISEELSSTLNEEWKVSAHGYLCKKQIEGPMSISNNVQFERKVDTMLEHYSSYMKMYTPILITPNVDDNNAPSLPENGGNQYIIKIEVHKPMPEYELIIGADVDGVTPIKFKYSDNSTDWKIETDRARGKFIISFTIRAYDAQKQCIENKFPEAFNIVDAVNGNITKNGMECFSGEIYKVKVKGKDGVFESNWSVPKRFQFKC